MAFIAEAAVSSLLRVFFGKFLDSYQFKFVTENQVRKEIENWKSILSDIREVLADAEEEQMRSMCVKNWLVELEDVAYDVDDILDEFATEALVRKKEQKASTGKAPKFKPTCFNGLQPSSIKYNFTTMSNIEKITKRLADLATRKSYLKLSGGANYVGRPMSMTIPRRPPSTSLVNEANVRGRDNDKRAILDLLSRDDGVDAGVYSVIPIVGMGGIGKTTLAQLVYNDRKTKDHFDLRAWVCVSEEFEIIRITKTILLSDPPVPCDTDDLNLLQLKLKEKLLGKKFLFVLDDVWNEKYIDWEKLRSPFDVGNPGSRIIVTTCSSIVSSIMTTVAGYPLQCLSKEDSLHMLAHDALEREDFTGHSNLEEIGLEIVKKCGHLPLAIKTIGGLLRTRVNRDAWEDILEGNIWNLLPEKSNVSPALWLSYCCLPSKLKQCFAYCSLIPKNYKFDEEEIVLLWMAEGFLGGANSKESKEKIKKLGRKYFQELVSRSFFQATSKKKSRFVMHDVINDLAQLVGGEKYFLRERHEDLKCSSRTRHSSYIMGQYENKMIETFREAKSLRTFLPFEMQGSNWNLSENVLNNVLVMKYLRVLSLKRYNITEIPDSIGNLRHLRYLDLSYTNISSLPLSICSLYNLYTIILKHYQHIVKISSEVGTFFIEQHIDILGADCTTFSSCVMEYSMSPVKIKRRRLI